MPATAPKTRNYDSTSLANGEHNVALAEVVENLSDDEEKDEMKHQINLLSQDQIEHLRRFIEFIDNIRKDIEMYESNRRFAGNDNGL